MRLGNFSEVTKLASGRAVTYTQVGLTPKLMLASDHHAGSAGKGGPKGEFFGDLLYKYQA